MSKLWQPWQLLGEGKPNGVLIVGDHGSNAVPPWIDLGLTLDVMQEHVYWDIGVAGVAQIMTSSGSYAAFLGAQSRLVVDLNRDPDDQAVIPEHSDGHMIIGNRLDDTGRIDRLADFHHPYHAALTQQISAMHPSLILSLHSFTPALRNSGEQRPWQIGVLYNEQAAASELAIGFLEGQGMRVGDQLPYSGKMLNATMNRHAEARSIPYIGIEMRQDLVSELSGQARFAQILDDMCQHVAERLALPRGN